MNREVRLLVVAVLIAVLGGCMLPQQPVALPARRPLGMDIPAYVAAGDPSASRPSDTQVKEPSGALTLRDALALALVGNPELAASSWEIRAAEARALQASLPPNPELEAEAEEIFGTGGAKGVGSAEVSLVLSQLVEMGGKRARRVRVAALEGELAGWDYEARRRTVLTDTTKAFVEVLAAEGASDGGARDVLAAEGALPGIGRRGRGGSGGGCFRLLPEPQLGQGRVLAVAGAAAVVLLPAPVVMGLAAQLAVAHGLAELDGGAADRAGAARDGAVGPHLSRELGRLLGLRRACGLGRRRGLGLRLRWLLGRLGLLGRGGAGEIGDLHLGAADLALRGLARGRLVHRVPLVAEWAFDGHAHRAGAPIPRNRAFRLPRR